MCGADPSGDPPGSMCFARVVERKNLGPGPAHQRRNDRGGEENCKAAANTLRKIRTVPAERNPLNRVLRHEIPRSNASFETKHRPPAEFQGLPSWEKSVAHDTRFCEHKIAPRFFSANSRLSLEGIQPPRLQLQCHSRPDARITLTFSKSRERACCLGRSGLG